MNNNKYLSDKAFHSIVRANNAVVISISNDKILSVLRRNDRFLSMLNKGEAELIEEDNKLEKVEAKSTINADLWTSMKLVDMMTDRLSRIEVIISGNVQIEDREQVKVYEFDCSYRVPKYSEEVTYIAQHAAFYECARVLTLHLSDLGLEILRIFQMLDTKSQLDVITAVGKRLFKLYYPHYFNYIGYMIKVKVEA